MKKKLLIAVLSVVLVLATVLAGCTPAIDVSSLEKIDENMINVFQNAITESINTANAGNYYIKQQTKELDKNDKPIKTIEYRMNFKKDDETIAPVDNTKLKLDIIHTIGLESFTESYTIGQAVKSDVKNVQPSDYKPYIFSNYKKTENSAVFTKEARELTNGIQDYINQEVASSAVSSDKKIAIKDYTMESVLAPLKELTKDDIAVTSENKETNKVLKNGNFTKGKVQHFAFLVTKKGHPYAEYGVIQVQVFNKKISRIMSADEKHILDTMYEGPKLGVPNYDTFTQSGVEVAIVSDRTDGMVALYDYAEDGLNLEIVALVNPKEVSQNAEEEITLVDSAVNWNNTYTEVVYKGARYFIQTKNIVNNSTDWNGMIPMIALVVALLALIFAFVALRRIKKQNKALTKEIKILKGEEVVAEVAENEVAGEQTNEAVETSVACEENVDENVTEENAIEAEIDNENK